MGQRPHSRYFYLWLTLFSFFLFTKESHSQDIPYGDIEENHRKAMIIANPRHLFHSRTIDIEKKEKRGWLLEELFFNESDPYRFKSDYDYSQKNGYKIDSSKIKESVSNHSISLGSSTTLNMPGLNLDAYPFGVTFMAWFYFDKNPTDALGDIFKLKSGSKVIQLENRNKSSLFYRRNSDWLLKVPNNSTKKIQGMDNLKGIVPIILSYYKKKLELEIYLPSSDPIKYSIDMDLDHMDFSTFKLGGGYGVSARDKKFGFQSAAIFERILSKKEKELLISNSKKRVISIILRKVGGYSLDAALYSYTKNGEQVLPGVSASQLDSLKILYRVLQIEENDYAKALKLSESEIEYHNLVMANALAL